MAALPPPAYQPPRRDPSSSDEEGGLPRGVWVLLGAIAAAKLSTLAVVLWLSWSPEAGLLAALVTWHWLPVAAVLLSGPVLFRVRLRRVRARRDALRRAEWMVGGERPAAGPGVLAPVPRPHP